MQIYVYRKKTKQSTAVTVENTDQILLVKQKVMTEFGKSEEYNTSDIENVVINTFSTTSENLTFNGEVLQLDRQLKDSGIVNQSELILEPAPKLYVKIPGRKMLEITMDHFHSVRELKFNIFHQTGIPSYQQRLTFGGNQLENEMDLLSNFENGALFDLEILENSITAKSRGKPITIFFKSLTMKMTPVVVFENDYVFTAIQKYCQKAEVPIEMLSVVYDGKQLDVEETLSELKIKDGTVIHSILKLRGC